MRGVGGGAAARQGQDSRASIAFMAHRRFTSRAVSPPHTGGAACLQQLHVVSTYQQEARCSSSNGVVLFLEEAGLSQYASCLLGSGFDELETLLEIEDADLKDLGVPRGHALKLKRRLREYELQEYAQAAPNLVSKVQNTRRSLDGSVSRQKVMEVRTPLRSLAQSQVPASAARSMPTDKMKSAVEQSWEQVQALGTYTVGELLHRHLFEIMPDAIHLFPSHVRMKYREWSADEEGDDDRGVHSCPALRKLFSKFVNAVGCAVAGLHNSTQLVPMLTQLGARHINYGVCESHWEALGKAFHTTLAEILGHSYTQEVQAAWHMAYGFMSSIMIEGLRAATADREAELVGKLPGPDNLDASASQSGVSTAALPSSAAPLPPSVLVEGSAVVG